MTDLEIMLAKANNVGAEMYPSKVEERVREEKDYKIAGNEIAIIRKEIKHLADALSVPLSEEFLAYYSKMEEIKAEVKTDLHLN
jgi:hypothetical protein